VHAYAQTHTHTQQWIECNAAHLNMGEAYKYSNKTLIMNSNQY